jgi:hypothetical protein
LEDEHSLQHSEIDQGHAEKRLIRVLVSIDKILKTWMLASLGHVHWPDQFADQPGQTFVKAKTQSADAGSAKTHGCRQNQVCPIGLQKVRGTNFRFKPLRNQFDDVHQRLGGPAGFLCANRYFFQSQNMQSVALICGVVHRVLSSSSRQRAGCLCESGRHGEC